MGNVFQTFSVHPALQSVPTTDPIIPPTPEPPHLQHTLPAMVNYARLQVEQLSTRLRCERLHTKDKTND